MDGWPVHVPEEVRVVLREIGGVETEENEYRFRPRGRASFDDGYWTLGELDFGEGSLIVGGGSGGWGPVVAVRKRRDDADVAVEAAAFVSWLAAFTQRLADGAADRPAARHFVPALSTVEVAEGTDTGLTALVGRGDSLIDLVDLRALPGYPCAVGWEPYFSTSSSGSWVTAGRCCCGAW